MQRRIGRHVAAAALAAGVTTGAPLAADRNWADADALAALDGRYASASVESWYGGYGTREFTFDDGRWALVFTHAMDPDMRQKTFRFRTGGPYVVGAPSPVVDGAFHTIFHEHEKHLTLLSDAPDVAARMGLADCALEPGVERDISVSGCASWRPVADCGEDHDLLAMDARGLHFGVRPADNDLCSAEKTPTALLPPVVAR